MLIRSYKKKVTFSSHFNFNVHAARQFELHQGVDGFGGGAVNVQQSFVGGELELLSGFLVYKSGTVHGENLRVRWQGDRAYQYNFVVLDTIDRFHDLFG